MDEARHTAHAGAIDLLNRSRRVAKRAYGESSRAREKMKALSANEFVIAQTERTIKQFVEAFIEIRRNESNPGRIATCKIQKPKVTAGLKAIAIKAAIKARRRRRARSQHTGPELKLR
ncbi:hypothetical protein GCM10010885_23680 [Alicyclobacillus cellulosilyticus]|uniref:Uncharacterized protein n=1 Tax=Alicyclobacillus cellulosilyticus TaxID=1003997 RepID=A0A917KJD7_9BACL|nr:hypothetical protein [Alicyclobacillus cellulosilyticus]GGJ13646.1 hypothetical protein GCM10010885_23680 [Alicyclobacillus cellulosilyticus]